MYLIVLLRNGQRLEVGRCSSIAEFKHCYPAIEPTIVGLVIYVHQNIVVKQSSKELP
jgi:hypothetical protein